MDLGSLEDSPFGRELHLLAHRLPRRCKLGGDWEIERGFHLEVLAEDRFQLTLAARNRSGQSESLPFRPGTDQTGRQSFLVWHCPGRYNCSRFEEFAGTLVEHPEVEVGLILSHTSERAQALLDYPKFRGLWRGVEQPVLQVFCDFPDSSYFTVERNLFHLGRIGRRLIRLGKWRRLMPW